MSSSIDLDAYFARINWGGATVPILETLAGLLRAHMRRIPFETGSCCARSPTTAAFRS
jgi:N-hydroxyarylamine O-acetyltransferase